MRIDTLTAGKIYDDWNSIPVHQTVEKLSSNQEALSSCAEWGKNPPRDILFNHGEHRRGIP